MNHSQAVQNLDRHAIANLDATLNAEAQDAEIALLASILIDPVSFPEVRMELRDDSDAFQYRPHRLIYESMIHLDDSGNVPEVLTLRQQLADDGNLTEVGGEAYLGEISGRCPSSANLLQYVEIVRSHKERREVGRLLVRASELHLAGRPAEEVHSLFKGRDGFEKGDDANADYEPFPTDILPEVMRDYISVGAASIGCDHSYIALPLFCALASAIGNSRVIRLKQGWEEPCVIWAAIVGESGTLKSPALDYALRPMLEHEVSLYREWSARMKEHESGKEMPPDHDLVKRSQTCVNDVTIEGLASLLYSNPRGLLLYKDELSGWFGGFDRYSKSETEASKYLEMQRAGMIRVDRKKDSESQLIERAAVSITGGIQPGTLVRLLKPKYFQNGLAARLLLAMPPRKPKRWNDNEILEDSVMPMKSVFETLLRQPYDPEEGPAVSELSEAGREAWIRHFNFLAAEMHLETDPNVVSALAKLEGYAARFALVVHAVRETVESSLSARIDEQDVAVGAKLARWFAYEARRVYRMISGTERAQSKDAELVSLISSVGGRITVRDLTRKRKKFRPSATARKALTRLVKLNLGSWNQVEIAGKPGPKSEEFILKVAAPENDSDKFASFSRKSEDLSYVAGDNGKDRSTYSVA